jgi:selenocysteine lyase/cysteine desulfurase
MPGDVGENCVRLREKGLMCGAVECGDARLDLEWDRPHSIIRLSPHCFNTFEECRKAAELVIEQRA